MKVRYIGKENMDYLVPNNSMALTYGKVYDVIHIGKDKNWYGLIDDSEDEEYAYPSSFFEIVEE